VVLRCVRPDDKERLRAGFQRLSPESRYLRFHGVKTELSEQELRYLTEIDGVRHFALGAHRAGNEDDGVGIARLIQLDGEPGVAEAAITVADDMQGKGLGTLLFQRLVAAAAERGIEHVRCLVLGSNHAMQDLLRKLALADTRVTIEQGVATIDLRLDDAALYELLRLAAQRVFSFGGGA
jgi:GNAT superfamily N-acetyltransferase